jgi:hypothetical protein
MEDDLVDDHLAFAHVNNAHLGPGTLLKLSPVPVW